MFYLETSTTLLIEVLLVNPIKVKVPFFIFFNNHILLINYHFLSLSKFLFFVFSLDCNIKCNKT